MSSSTDLCTLLASRRRFLKHSGQGFGMLGLAACLSESVGGASLESHHPLAARTGHQPTPIRSVIWLFMNGGPSQVDTWDYKPQLAARDGQELPDFDKNTGFFTGAVGPLMKSPFQFSQHGESGAWVSEIFPNLAQHVDKLAFIHSCWTDSNNHAPALFKINTGSTRQGFPCFGSWVTYGLGSESRNLPAFVVMYDTLGRGVPKGHAQNWGAGFLPTVYQGTALKPQGDPIDNLRRPPDVSADRQRRQLDLLAELNREQLTGVLEQEEFVARMESFELAYRMQMTAPEVLDLSRESAATQRMYGTDDPKCGHFAKQCILSRRLVEQGVRCVQIYSGGMENERSWDGHQNIAGNHRGFAAETDQPIAALLSDLEARGLLESTLVVWGGEFGRLPLVQKGGSGRDHNPHAFTVWLAGGGVRGGTHYGETDEIGHRAVVDRVSVPDLHATLLHLMGMDHERLTYRFNGRDFRLTDVSGRVVREILA
ncbi:MAG: DUF1501 domain-containing protein [Planctomycetaceae bacterium]|nr:DUF1501 domain-containing protein [Planctomycetaceae bacterium]